MAADNSKCVLKFQQVDVSQNDLLRLADNMHLNDSIVEMWIRYVESEMMSPQDRDKTHIFSTYFYPTLIKKRHDLLAVEDNPYLTEVQKRHNRVKRWTDNFDVFAKEFLIVPMNQRNHWFLVTIQYAGQVDKTASASEDDQLPRFVIFDSYPGHITNYDEICSILRDYLRIEHQIRKGTDCEFTEINLPVEIATVANQTNLFDCGIHLLHNLEVFFVSSNCAKINEGWIDPPQNKRKSIYETIIQLIKKNNNN